MRLAHPIEPVFDAGSEKLILGSFPSEASRTTGFYYGHPQNRFWKLLALIYDEALPLCRDEKLEFLHSHRLALWDVAAECEVSGSADAQITDAVPNNIDIILSFAPIKQIYVNGRLAETLYKKFILPATERDALYLPSTSPANAVWSLERLAVKWSVIKD